MKKALIVGLLLGAANLPAQTDPVEYATQGTAAQQAVENSRLEYVERYKDIAIREMNRSGIPASIKLGQGILESNAGQSELALNANNHFGIKCGNDWRGKSVKKKDDDRDANGNLIESCFRKYDNPDQSFTDHSEFLRDPRKYNRYGFLFNLDKRDYKGWAHGLQAAGYATSNVYAITLIDVIERYRLYVYDLDANTGGPYTSPNTDEFGNPSPTIPLRRIGSANDVKVILAREGETLNDIARLYRIKLEKIVDYNDRGYTPYERLRSNVRVFLQSKRNRWRGRSSYHYVMPGQDMFEISQQYGVKLSSLYKFNRMRPGEEPAEGEKVSLKKKRRSSDPIRLRDQTDPSPISTPTSPQAMVPDESTPLFEISEGQSGAPANKPGQGNNPLPATTGVPYPADPTPADPRPGNTIPPQKPVAPPAQQVFHTVVKGDTLFSLSRKYNTTVSNIKSLNNLQDNTIKIGEKLRVQ